MDISIVISLLNEEESLPELTNWIRRVMEQHNYEYEIIYIDDGSTDKSWSVISDLAQSDSHIKSVKFTRNYGKSAALHVGFERARGEVIFTMDADLQDSPEEIPEMYDMIIKEGYDLVSGWKKKRYDPVLSKNIPSKLFNAVVRGSSGIRLHDFNCGLKAYRKAAAKAIEVYGDMHRFIPILVKKAGYDRITEKPVKHQQRKYGKSKFGMSRFINGFLDLLSVMFMTKFAKRPMHFFGTLGSFSFFMGFVILVYFSIAKIFFHQYHMTDRPLFYLGLLTVIFGTQMFVTGFLAELVSRTSNERNHYLIEEELNLDEN
jgi:glycosyltransferase involved in cell wall biosynthesis